LEQELQKLRIDKEHKARRRGERTLWPFALLVLLVIAGGAGLWQWHAAAAAPVVRTVRVRVPDAAATASSAPANSDADTVVLNATGYVMAAHKIELASKVIGRVAWVGVEMGDKIAKDQVLVRLEDDEYKARVAEQQGQLDNAKAKLAELEAGSRPEEIAEAHAGMAQAKAQLTNAETNLQRLKDLDTARTVSKQEYSDAETLVESRKAIHEAASQRYEMARIGPRKEQIDAQRATVRQLEGGLSLSMVELNNTVIRSPISGTVLERNVEVGEFVTTGFVGDRGAKGYVVSIADLTDLRVELDVSQNDFAKVAVKQPCWITTDAYPDKKYNGTVDLISPEANRQKATVQVRVKVLNPDDLLRPDMNATVSFLSQGSPSGAGHDGANRRPAAIRVPAGTVHDGAAFVVEDSRAVRRPVTAGRNTTGGEIEILKGLIGGEDLVLSPPPGLKDGDKVKVQNDKE
jgi:HlyD family secretion protein